MMSIDGESTEDIFSQLCNDNGVSYLPPSPQESEDAARIRREQLKELVTRFVHFDTCVASVHFDTCVACPDYLRSFCQFAL